MEFIKATAIRDLVEEIKRKQSELNEIKRQSENGRVDIICYSPDKSIPVFGDNANVIRKIIIEILEKDLENKKYQLRQL